ncbi:MAG TPA: aminoacetone oxidase family FAD-binding enzyme [Vicinamibacterales bacterium]|nr:aminoacetone oxidase family FAD-binding enzyme [Vicinamibacterales bacterium]
MDFFKLGCDVAVVGAGAAGLAAGIFTRRDSPRLSVAVLDGSPRPGAKILVSGGTRCNVTNSVVTDGDFWGGKRTIVRRVLNALPVADTVRFFEEIGVPLHEEPGGKLFPDSNRARDVLDALLRELARRGGRLQPAARVSAVRKANGGFELQTSAGPLNARVVVLATGGRSLPKTGSDGAGYELARTLGHSLVAQTPALVPLVLEPHGIHAALSGTAVDVELSVWVDGAIATRLSGALLFTHFGVSGPVVLNASRHWARARVEQRDARVTVNFRSGSPFDAVDREWIDAARDRPHATLRGFLSSHLPEKLAGAMLGVLGLPADGQLSSLTRDDRRRLVHALVAWPLPVIDTRGYNYAEVTAGGVRLDEIHPQTMESRVCPGLFLVGEILDVDGRIGGFNFQWAWSSARAAARGIRLSEAGTPLTGAERP